MCSIGWIFSGKNLLWPTVIPSLGKKFVGKQKYCDPAIPTTRLDRVFVDARAQTWQHVASMENRCRQCLPPQGRSSCARMPTNTQTWRFGNFVWILGKKHCALKFENKQGFGTCPKSFFGGKKCKTSSLWFRTQWVQYSGVLHTGVNRLSLGSNSEGCVRGLKSLKGLF